MIESVIFRKSNNVFHDKVFMTFEENECFNIWSLKEDFPFKDEGIGINNRYVIPEALHSVKFWGRKGESNECK